MFPVNAIPALQPPGGLNQREAGDRNSYPAVVEEGQGSVIIPTVGDALALRQLREENASLRSENDRLKDQIKDLMTTTDDKFQKVVQMIETYEKRHIIEKEETVVETTRKQEEDLFGLVEEKRVLEAKLEDKSGELRLMEKLLSKKQEDFTFSMEQLKDVKTWAKRTIREVEAKAEEAIAKRDQRIYECEREIFRKQETVDQVLKLLHREKTKCEKLVLSTNELTRKLEGDLEFKLRILNREVERVMKVGDDRFRAWPFRNDPTSTSSDNKARSDRSRSREAEDDGEQGNDNSAKKERKHRDRDHDKADRERHQHRSDSSGSSSSRHRTSSKGAKAPSENEKSHQGRDGASGRERQRSGDESASRRKANKRRDERRGGHDEEQIVAVEATTTPRSTTSVAAEEIVVVQATTLRSTTPRSPGAEDSFAQDYPSDHTDTMKGRERVVQHGKMKGKAGTAAKAAGGKGAEGKSTKKGKKSAVSREASPSSSSSKNAGTGGKSGTKRTPMRPPDRTQGAKSSRVGSM
ncbi:unnamed protein product [Amoebophrya sp. A25]|nr:unnamed protein product [Amoebophrya sp. A25]|eukprot:GSA25T00026979001.1